MLRSSIKFVQDFLTGPLTGAEIGVRDGQHAVWILKLDIKRLYLVDSYELSYSANADDWYKQAHSLTLPHFRKVVWLVMTSEEAARIVNDEFDFVYIDGDHRYEFVKADLELWFPKIRTGGVLCRHDYVVDNSIEGVQDVAPAVDEFVKARNLKLYRDYPKDPNIFSDWWTVKE